MRTHITVIAWLHIALSVLVMLGGVLLLVLFTSMGAFVGSASGKGDISNYVPTSASFTVVGIFVFLLFAVYGLPGIILGWGLLQYAPWARILGIVVSILDLINFPLGTALGVYGLVILFNSETVALFEGRRPSAY